MSAQVSEATSGWPLGLENMNARLRLREAFRAVSMEHDSFHTNSISSFSFSSSDLDTESTKSFFQDRVTLGRLIGIQPGNGDSYFTDTAHHEEYDHFAFVRVASHAPDRHGMEACNGICVPLLLNVLVKISRNRNSSRH